MIESLPYAGIDGPKLPHSPFEDGGSRLCEAPRHAASLERISFLLLPSLPNRQRRPVRRLGLHTPPSLSPTAAATTTGLDKDVNVRRLILGLAGRVSVAMQSLKSSGESGVY